MENTTTLKTREALINDVDKLKRDAAQVAQDVRNHANAHVDETKRRMNETILTVRESLTSHPFTLLGIGFVFGFLFGFRFGR